MLVETVFAERTASAVRWRVLEVSVVFVVWESISVFPSNTRRSPAWDSGHAGLVLSDDLDASWVAFGEELAGWCYEVGGYPTVGTRDVGGFGIVCSVVRMTPLSNALRGGGGGQILERKGARRESTEVTRTWTQRT